MNGWNGSYVRGCVLNAIHVCWMWWKNIMKKREGEKLLCEQTSTTSININLLCNIRFFCHCWHVWLSFFTPSKNLSALIVISQNRIHFNLLHTHTYVHTVEPYWRDHVRQAMTTYGITSLTFLSSSSLLLFVTCHFDFTLPFFFVCYKGWGKKRENIC